MKRYTALACTLVTFLLALAVIAPARADSPTAVVKAFYAAYQKAPERDQATSSSGSPLRCADSAAAGRSRTSAIQPKRA